MALTIRKTVFDDIHEIMQWVNEPEVLATFANFKTISFEEEAAFLLQLLKSKTDFTFTLLYDNQYAGQVSLNKIYWAARNGRMALFLKKEFRGKGLGEKAIALLLQKAFEEVALH
ncbi:MAG: GNAT family N-acetyltransferase [Thermonemataceae bacterium]